MIDCLEDWPIGFILLAMGALLIFLMISFAGALLSPPPKSISLQRTHWKCASHADYTSEEFVGKILMPVTRRICTEYKRVKK